jgi:hypothetical protein
MSDNGVFKSFSTNTGTFGTKEFLESNSLVAKLAFLLLVIFLFIILLRFGISILSYFLFTGFCLYLIHGRRIQKPVLSSM